MATAPVYEPDSGLEDQNTSDAKLQEVFDRAMRNFDVSVLPQLEQRRLCLIARRFVNIPGAMWEGDFGDCFPDEIKLEIPLVKDGIDKIKRDYNENRIVPDFRPANGKGDDQSADTLDGMYRADAYFYGADDAWDNAFSEGVDGGFGAYRLTQEYADPYDKESDAQRINPGCTITDADQRVYFGPSDRYDKCDAPYAFLITAHARVLFEEQYPEGISDWPQPRIDPPYDWFTPDVVKTAEYYEKEDVTEKLYILTHRLSQAEERYWDSEIDDSELADLKKMGWQVKTRQMKRCRVHKYILSGSEVLEDKGLIAGDRIPIVPFFGKRAVVDGIERYEGYTQQKMDIQKLYNAAVSKMAETSAQSSREIPIFAASQIPPHLATMWERQVVDRHPYALVEPLLDPTTGGIVSGGPIGKVEAPQVDPNTAAVLQIARTDLTENQDDGSDEVKANTSADALEVAATRVDARSGIYLDNWRKSTKCGGEIYVSQCADVYFEPGREVETMSEDGNDGTATLVQPYVNQQGKAYNQNDFTRGHYKVVVDVTEATATRRDKTVKSCMNMASVAVEAQDQDLARVLLLTAVMNTDGEGLNEVQDWSRKQLLALGATQPTDEEKAAMEQAAEEQSQQPPDPNVVVAQAKAADLAASAKQRAADTVLKLAQAQAVGGPDAAPTPPDGLEAVHKIAQIGKTAAETEHLRTQTEHLPQQLAIEATNARTNAVKAHAQAHSSRFQAVTNFFKAKSNGKAQQ
jgi:hypothetical protein